MQAPLSGQASARRDSDKDEGKLKGSGSAAGPRVRLMPSQQKQILEEFSAWYCARSEDSADSGGCWCINKAQRIPRSLPMQDAGCCELRRDHGLIASPCRDGIIHDKDQGVLVVGAQQECHTQSPVPFRKIGGGREVRGILERVSEQARCLEIGMNSGPEK